MIRYNIWRGLVVALSLSSAAFPQIVIRDLPTLSTPQQKALATPGSDKLDPRLRRLVKESADKSLSATAKSIGIPATDELVSVQLTGPADSLDSLEATVTNNGGEVETTYNGVIYARVPVALLETLGNRKELAYAGPQAEYEMHYQIGGAAKASEGLAAAAVGALHSRGITGKGVKIGIIDGGFTKYGELMQAGLLPKPAAAIAVNARQTLENTTQHGTGCAEIIHQMAPDAQLYLASVDLTTGPILKAVQWMMSQGVQVINFSVGSTYRGDGRDDLSLIVEETTRKAGMTWLVSAGNEGDAHWLGSSRNVHSSGFLQVGSAGNAIKITARSPVTQLMLRWDDWGNDPRVPSATQDLDMFVLARNAQGAWAVVAKADDPQNGANAMPLEAVRFQTQPGQEFFVMIRPTRVNRQLRVHLYASGLHTGPDPKLEPAVSTGSIAAPALTRAAVAVGAVDVLSHSLAPYSSQGPTDDGRTKPDIAAPTGTTSAAYADQGGRFHGTSASAPHATGFAALLKQMMPQASSDRMRQALVTFVRPMGAAAPNDQYGFGHIDGARAAGNSGGSGSGTGVSRRRSLTLPRSWGGEISLASIERVRSSDANDLDVKVVVGKSEYRVGDGMKIGYRANQDCYFLLINRDANGNYSLVAPMDGEQERLQGGEKYALPRGQETIKVTGPGGPEEVILIASKRPIDLNNADPSQLSISIAKYEVIQ